MSKVSRSGAWLFLVAVIARLAFHLLTRYVADDAFITFRYAEHLAYGEGFVYNDGEHVLGTSTPLFTFVLSLLVLLRIPLPLGALIISLAASGLTAVVLYHFARSLRFTTLAALPALAYALWPRSVASDVDGMETAFFALLVTAAFYYQHRRLEVYALGMATLATVTRPEGLGLLIILLVYDIYRQPSSWWRYLISPLIILGPWLVFAWYYFGSPVPNSIPAKLALYSQFGAAAPEQALTFLLGLRHLGGWVALAMVVAGAWWLNRKQNFGTLELIWMAAMVIFFTVARTHLFAWYIAPIYPIYMLFAMAAVRWALDRARFSAIGERQAAFAAAAVIGLVLLVACYPQVRNYRQTQQTLENVHEQVGAYLALNASSSATVAAEDIGYIGYFSKRYVLDRDGLVSPAAIPYNRDARYLDLILDKRPSYVVAATDSPISNFLDNPRFLGSYQEVKRFSYAQTTYVICARTP